MTHLQRNPKLYSHFTHNFWLLKLNSDRFSLDLYTLTWRSGVIKTQNWRDVRAGAVAKVQSGVVWTLQEGHLLPGAVKSTQPVGASQAADRRQFVVVVRHSVLVRQASTHDVRVRIVPVPATNATFHSVMCYDNLALVTVASSPHREWVLICKTSKSNYTLVIDVFILS
jgi:hypothetical protein